MTLLGFQVVLLDEQDDEIEQRLQEAAPNGIVDMGAKATRDLVETDVPALLKDARELRAHPCAAPGDSSGPTCGWPTCGCDPYAVRVIEALQAKGLIPWRRWKREMERTNQP